MTINGWILSCRVDAVDIISVGETEEQFNSLGCEVGVDEAGAGKEEWEREMTREGRDSAGCCDGSLGSGGVPVGW